MAAGALLLAFGQTDALALGPRAATRALAGLVQLAMLLVPLAAIVPAAAGIAGEREAGTLDVLLALPVSRGRVFLGKALGLVLAGAGSIVVGFGAVGALAAARGVPATTAAALLACTALLAAAFAALGLAISSRAGSRSRATSMALGVWLSLVALGSLGVMAAFVRMGLPPAVLEAWALIDPIEAYRLAALAILEPDLALLGPAGAALLEDLGRGGVLALAGASLVAWTGIALALGARAFSTAEARAA